MERYDYMEHLKQDIREWMGDNEYAICPADYDDWTDYYEALYEDLWMADGVTGNASGSYTFSTWDAEECLCHNWDLMQEMCDEFGSNPRTSNPESLDVGIRCYLLGQALDAVITEIKDEYPGKTPAEIYEEV